MLHNKPDKRRPQLQMFKCVYVGKEKMNKNPKENNYLLPKTCKSLPPDPILSIFIVLLA
jgi:hypothetical protein